MKIIFFGTPPFAAQVLEFLLQNQVEVVAVISKPDRPKGRSSTPVPTPVKLVAQSYHLPLYQPEVVSSLDFAPALKNYEADLFVVVAYGEIIKQHLLDMPKRACINLHASLLPKYRGAAPIQRSIIEGEKETGVTIMHMVKKMDAGDIIKKVSVQITSEMTYGELEQALCQIGKHALLEVIKQFDRGEPSRQIQDSHLATFAPKIELEDCELDWNQSAQHLHDLVRGVNPHPGAWCYVKVNGEQKRLKISRTRVIPYPSNYPGTILDSSKGNLKILTGDQALELVEVQLEGKKTMSSEQWIRGMSKNQLKFLVD